MVTPESVKSGIERGLACDHVEVIGDGQHFQAVVVSGQFAGKNRVQRHQLVYAALGDRMRREVLSWRSGRGYQRGIVRIA